DVRRLFLEEFRGDCTTKSMLPLEPWVGFMGDSLSRRFRRIGGRRLNDELCPSPEWLAREASRDRGPSILGFSQVTLEQPDQFCFWSSDLLVRSPVIGKFADRVRMLRR